jgi:kynurenine formamidase
MTRFIDLSHPLVDGLPHFDSDPALSIEVYQTVQQVGFNLTRMVMGSHQGTHLDAPFHFFDEGKTLDRIPLERFYGPARVIDLAPGGELEPETPITVAMLEPFEELFVPGGKILYRTGWDRRFGQEAFFSGFPDLTLEAAQWIADRRIGLLGMDTPTPSKDFLPCHHILLGQGVEIVIVEGLTRLEELPDEFVFAGFPLNIAGRDGSPIRAVAILED